MKRILLLAIALAVTIEARAQTNVSVPLQINIPMVLELTAEVRRMPLTTIDPFGAGTTPTSSMDFVLRYNGNGRYMPDTHFCVIMTANASAPYKLTQSCAGIVFVNGSSVDFGKKITITPAYSETDKWAGGAPQGPMPSADYLGDSASAMYSEGAAGGRYYEAKPSIISGNWLMYSSYSGQTQRIRCYYDFYNADPVQKARWGLPTGIPYEYSGFVVGRDLVGVKWNAVGGATADGSVVFTLTRIS